MALIKFPECNNEISDKAIGYDHPNNIISSAIMKRNDESNGEVSTGRTFSITTSAFWGLMIGYLLTFIPGYKYDYNQLKANITLSGLIFIVMFVVTYNAKGKSNRIQSNILGCISCGIATCIGYFVTLLVDIAARSLVMLIIK